MAAFDPGSLEPGPEPTPPDHKLQFTRARDLLAVGAIALIVGYLLVRWNYGRLPVLPRPAGLSAAVVGIGEALAGFNIRARLRLRRGPGDEGSGSGSKRRAHTRSWAGDLEPLPPLLGARAVMVAKASSLAGAGLAGLWAGLLVYVLPSAGAVKAADADSVTGVIGLLSALIMMLGALWLERCLVDPQDTSKP